MILYLFNPLPFPFVDKSSLAPHQVPVFSRVCLCLEGNSLDWCVIERERGTVQYMHLCTGADFLQFATFTESVF